MSYVDAYFNKDKDIIHVVERDKKGRRNFVDYKANYQFFITDPNGKYRSIYDESISKIVPKTNKDFHQQVKKYSNQPGVKIYESDLNKTFVCLSDNYTNASPPPLHVAFWDIETDFQAFAYDSRYIVKIRKDDEIKELTVFQLSTFPNREHYEIYDVEQDEWVHVAHCVYLKPGPGYSSTDDACLPITAITIYLQWLDELITLALPPATITMDEAMVMMTDIPNVVLFDDERKMLDTFLDLIEDVDILSGYNCSGYDIPFTINRLRNIRSKEATKRFCLWGQLPTPIEIEKYGKKINSYHLVGRVNLDYLDLYKKYTFEEQSSYRLDYIGEIEVGEKKVIYDGTLDQLYNNDFKKFILYNRQDVALLNKINEKLKFINTANTFAHANTVLLPTVLGTVSATEQAIINEAHSLGYRIPNRSKLSTKESTQAAGAYVAYPVTGLHKYIGSFDINSLYPSVIRALNMAPETLVAQIRQTHTDAYIDDKMAQGHTFAAAWEGIFASLEYDMVMNQDPTIMLHVDWSDGNSILLSSAEIYDLVFNTSNKLMMSANGTIFSYEKEGVIPGLLKKWYIERQSIQKEIKHYINLQYGIEVPVRFVKESI